MSDNQKENNKDSQQDNSNDNKDPNSDNRPKLFDKASLLRIFMFAAIGTMLFNPFNTPDEDKPQTEWDDFESYVEDGVVDHVTIYNGQQKIEVEYKDGHVLYEGKVLPVADVPADAKDVTKEFLTIPDGGNADMLEDLKEHDVEHVAKPQPTGTFGTLLFTMLPMALLIGFFIWMMRRQSGGMMSLNKMDLRTQKSKVSFDDVAGVEEAKEEFQEVIDFLKNPEKYTAIGGKMPKGVLMEGPPGVGKTLLAKAVAGEAAANFVAISGSDFVEMFVGRGAAKVRELFKNARAAKPCIIFIDEIDAVGQQRSTGKGISGGNDEREQTLNAILTEMDGIGTEDQGVFVIAATNRAELLDEALVRPGRFDTRISLQLPDIKGREAILKIHSQNLRIGEDVDFVEIAKGSSGMSGADLANLMNLSARLASRKGHTEISRKVISEARDQLIMAAARKSLILSQEEKEIAAWHEAGHTIAAWFDEHADPVEKVSILPRTKSGGVTIMIPEKDVMYHSKKKLLSKLSVYMAGRYAEEKKFDDITSGASNDIEQITKIATAMVTKFGMDGNLGMLHYGPMHGHHADYLGHDKETGKEVSDAIRKLQTDMWDKMKTLLDDKWDDLNKVAEALLRDEEIDSRDLREILGPSAREQKAGTPALQPPQNGIAPA